MCVFDDSVEQSRCKVSSIYTMFGGKGVAIFGVNHGKAP